jgi:diguanylate cyclase (GGDEF)-like protein
VVTAGAAASPVSAPAGVAGFGLAGMDIGAELGRGAHAVVFRARRGEAEYAVKMLRADGGGREAAAMMRREAGLLACVDHPAVARVFEVGEVGEAPYLVMELIEGQPLALVLEGGPLPVPVATRMVAALAGALAAAHRVGVVHRDVKPQNVMILPDGQPKLVDFGLASHGANSGEPPQVAGTFEYAAPEQTGMLARPVDGRADLYALGVVLFECLSGRRPFDAADVGELVRLHAVAAPPDLSALRAEVPEQLAAIVNRLLAKDPDDRYPSGDQVAADLHAVLAVADGQDPAVVTAAGRPLVGRQPELARLCSRWEQARLGAGGVARIIGPAGIGKTRLSDELRDRVHAAGYPVLTMSCSVDGVPLGALRTALDRYLLDIERMPDTQRAAALDRVRAAASEIASVLQLLSPALTAALQAPRLEDEDRQDQVTTAVVQFLAALAHAAGGLLLRIDGAQWLDAGSADILGQLIAGVREHPLLIVTTERQQTGVAGPPSWLSDGTAVVDTCLDLAPLPPAHIAELAAGQLGNSAVSAQLAAQLNVRSAGNPLAVLEYLRAMLDAAVIRPSWGSWILDEQAMDQLNLPANVLDLMLSRINDLRGDSLTLLQAAAALGTSVQPQLLARITKAPIGGVFAMVEEALTRGVLEVHGDAYAFLHQRAREAILAELDEPARRRLHQQIAETLDHDGTADPYAVARHYADGEPGRTPQQAFRACLTAAEAALSDQSPAQALHYLNLAQAAAGYGRLPLTAGYHRSRGLAQLRVGRLVDAQESLELAGQAEQDPLRRAELLGLIAEAQNSNYASADSAKTVQRALSEIGHPLPANPVLLLGTALAMFVVGVMIGWTGRGFGTVTGQHRHRYRVQANLYRIGAFGTAVAMEHTRSLAYHLRALYLVNRLGPGPEYARLQAAFGLIATIARWRRIAGRCYARAYAAAAASGDPRLTAQVAWTEATASDAVPGVGAQTGMSLQRVLDEHGRWLELSEYLSSVGCVGSILAFRGYAHEAAIWHSRAVARMASTVAVPGNPTAMLGVLVAAASGDREQTKDRLSSIRQLVARVTGDPGQQINLLIAAAHAAVELGGDGAAEAVDAVDAEVTRLRLTPRKVWAQQRSLWLYLAWGRLAQCRSAPEEHHAARLKQAKQAIAKLRRAANTPALRAYHHAAVADYLHLAGAHAAALPHLARADLLGTRLDLPLLSCEAATVRARTLRALDHHAEAGRQARQALRLAADHGWQHRAQSLRAEFRVTENSTSSRQTRSASTSSTTHSTAHRRLTALQQISLAAATVVDPDELARAALDETIRIFAAERAIIFLPDPDNGPFLPHLGRDAKGADLQDLTGYGATLIEQVRQTGQPLVVTSGEHGAALGSQSVLAHGLRSVMVAPLQIKGDLLGVLYLDSRVAKGVFTTDDIDTLAAITNQIAASMTTAHAAQLQATITAAQRRGELADTMRAAMARINQSLEPQTVSDRLLDTMVQTLGADLGLIIDAEYGCRTASTSRPDTTPHMTDADVAHLLATIQTPDVTNDSQPHPLLSPIAPWARSWLAIPLVSRQHPGGLLLLASGTPDRYTADQLRVGAALIEQGMVAYDNAVLFSRAERLAHTDPLTGLHNRRHFFALSTDALDQARKCGTALAAIMLDIDHFKHVNDTHGHGAGDDVIREVATRLRATLREGDLLGRYGGEEFAVVLGGAQPTTTVELAERLRRAIAEQPVPTRAGPLHITISNGTPQLNPADAAIDDTLTRADTALYHAKQDGRNRVATAK